MTNYGYITFYDGSILQHGSISYVTCFPFFDCLDFDIDLAPDDMPDATDKTDPGDDMIKEK